VTPTTSAQKRSAQNDVPDLYKMHPRSARFYL